MKFEVLNVLDRIRKLYDLPRTKERFDKYLFMLQGESKDELVLPIAGFNPMGKELAVIKLDELINLKAEEIAENTISKISDILVEARDNQSIQVVLNLVDNVEGSWSNFYTTDYSSKFEITSLVKRGFCTPYFWTSEDFDQEKIINRVTEYVFRTIYCIDKGTPKTLSDLFEQEVFVCQNSLPDPESLEDFEFNSTGSFLSENSTSEDYNLKFNFFYGDDASRSLGYPTFGCRENEGFDYARFISKGK